MGSTPGGARRRFSADELLVSARGEPTSGLHLAFHVPPPDRPALPRGGPVGAGGRDNGAPGERPYHPGYYAA